MRFYEHSVQGNRLACKACKEEILRRNPNAEFCKPCAVERKKQYMIKYNNKVRLRKLREKMGDGN